MIPFDFDEDCAARAPKAPRLGPRLEEPCDIDAMPSFELPEAAVLQQLFVDDDIFAPQAISISPPTAPYLRPAKEPRNLGQLPPLLLPGARTPDSQLSPRELSDDEAVRSEDDSDTGLVFVLDGLDNVGAVMYDAFDQKLPFERNVSLTSSCISPEMSPERRTRDAIMEKKRFSSVSSLCSTRAPSPRGMSASPR
jgi:hypothetical protein